MAYSRGASALEAAVALGEIDGKVGDQCILRDFELFSSVASTSAGIELMHNVASVLGNSASSASPSEIGHAVMRDAIDSAAVIDALKSVGKSALETAPSRRQAVASPNGSVRGFRHTMLEDTGISGRLGTPMWGFTRHELFARHRHGRQAHGQRPSGWQGHYCGRR